MLLAVRYSLFIALGMAHRDEPSLRALPHTDAAANVARQAAPILIMAVGMTFVMATAGIDLSVGSLVALVSVVMVALFQFGLPTIVLILVLVLAGVPGSPTALLCA